MTEKLPSYGSNETISVGRVTYAGILNPKRKLNYAVSNLVSVVEQRRTPNLSKVISKAVRGELGCTEVPPNQVW